jgi:hypothetical protein
VRWFIVTVVSAVCYVGLVCKQMRKHQARPSALQPRLSVINRSPSTSIKPPAIAVTRTLHAPTHFAAMFITCIRQPMFSAAPSGNDAASIVVGPLPTI